MVVVVVVVGVEGGRNGEWWRVVGCGVWWGGGAGRHGEGERKWRVVAVRGTALHAHRPNTPPVHTQR